DERVEHGHRRATREPEDVLDALPLETLDQLFTTSRRLRLHARLFQPHVPGKTGHIVISRTAGAASLDARRGFAQEKFGIGTHLVADGVVSGSKKGDSGNGTGQDRGYRAAIQAETSSSAPRRWPSR